MNTNLSLRDLVEAQLHQRWTIWAQDHPHLAEAIDHTHLVATTVQRLRDDPAFTEAMQASGLDEAQLAAAGQVLAHVEQFITHLLG